MGPTLSLMNIFLYWAERGANEDNSKMNLSSKQALEPASIPLISIPISKQYIWLVFSGVGKHSNNYFKGDIEGRQALSLNLMEAGGYLLVVGMRAGGDILGGDQAFGPSVTPLYAVGLSLS